MRAQQVERTRSALVLGLSVLGVLMATWRTQVRAEEAGDTITWARDLSTGLAKAQEHQRVLMVCVNARSVAGEKDEPAAKALREVVYKHPKVVERSRAFVCVFLTPTSDAAGYGELRALGVEGKLVSPQHIFIHPDGAKILLRREYWSYGQGERAVEALLALMDKAHARLDGEDAPVAAAEQVPAAPDDASARAAWIVARIADVERGTANDRDAALRSLIESDREGDCILPLTELLETHKKDPELLVVVVRALGRDGLALAAEPVAKLLAHKDPSVRGNAAVSLEYIGVGGKAVIAALRKMADRDKDPALANHAYRALGRCGAGDAKVRALLLKKAGSAKSEYASYGPCIGIAYFHKDKKAARGVEKILKRIGIPGSRRGGGGNVVKRGLVSWTLAAIDDPKSGPWVREELIGGLEHVKAFWVEPLVTFWDAVATHCEGDDNLLGGIEQGVRGFVSFSKGGDLGRYGAEVRNLMDNCRKERDSSSFRPLGDGLLDDSDES